MEDKILDLLAKITEVEEIKEDRNLNLFDDGILDSLSLIELLLALEEELGLKLEPTEIDREDIETPNKLLDYLVKRLQ